MKIVVLGSHGTGKTTLTRQIHKYLEENYQVNLESISSNSFQGAEESALARTLKGRKFTWKYLPESPVEAFRIGFTMNEDTSLESEWWIIAKQIEMETLTPPPWIADKCLIDIWVYAKYLFTSAPEFLEVAEGIVKKNINYDLVVYLPIGEFPIEDDGLRSLDPKFQKDIDDLLIDTMQEMSIPYYTLRGGKDTRLNQAKKIIDEVIYQ
jgi:nicotinamide riboside kinase